MYFEVEISSSVTVTVEAESAERAAQLAKEGATDMFVQDELGENADVVLTPEEVEDADGTNLFIDNSGTVHLK